MQDEGEKGLEDLHVYRLNRNKEKKVQRTLMSIDIDGPGTGCFWRRAAVERRGTILLFILRILDILLQTRLGETKKKTKLSYFS